MSAFAPLPFTMQPPVNSSKHKPSPSDGSASSKTTTTTTPSSPSSFSTAPSRHSPSPSSFSTARSRHSPSPSSSPSSATATMNYPIPPTPPNSLFDNDAAYRPVSHLSSSTSSSSGQPDDYSSDDDSDFDVDAECANLHQILRSSSIVPIVPPPLRIRRESTSLRPGFLGPTSIPGHMPGPTSPPPSFAAPSLPLSAARNRASSLSEGSINFNLPQRNSISSSNRDSNGSILNGSNNNNNNNNRQSSMSEGALSVQFANGDTSKRRVSQASAQSDPIIPSTPMSSASPRWSRPTSSGSSPAVDLLLRAKHASHFSMDSGLGSEICGCCEENAVERDGNGNGTGNGTMGHARRCSSCGGGGSSTGGTHPRPHRHSAGSISVAGDLHVSIPSFPRRVRSSTVSGVDALLMDLHDTIHEIQSDDEPLSPVAGAAGDAERDPTAGP
ncbi:hypothetical protein HK104_010104, partial [Borealophlyctis nickersoniae]